VCSHFPTVKSTQVIFTKVKHTAKADDSFKMGTVTLANGKMEQVLARVVTIIKTAADTKARCKIVHLTALGS